VQAVEQAATEHLERAWPQAGFTDLNHRATHPCGIFTRTPFPVFAKLDSSSTGEEQFTAERAPPIGRTSPELGNHP
jgi:hypothetical protein